MKKYTCPMHPEVASDKPGSCPKCGMDLVSKEQTQSDQGKQAKKMSCSCCEVK